ncbi:uncharacterized protein LOC118826984 [Colossoma macropomum]|uniref:uncharacterized protein LOC118826984 n=1 Tax=Colossoma macropomum TaxID=42526 RepID=UPI0018644AA2|nr:uncharacterized protein LOC118826984 [Colossoma macropomum]
MQSCSSALRVLILLVAMLIVVSESALPSVKVKLHDSATLPCSERCSGLVRWSVFHKPTDVLAECDQTSCRSKEGYQMIHDQYLKGDFSLIITEADFTKRDWYTCDCDGKDLCDVRLLVQPMNIPVQLKPGETLMLDLDIPDTVEVMHNSTGAADRSSGQICTVDGRSAQCKPEYTQRASLTSALALRAVTPSDSGVYTVMDQRNEEAIHIYEVTIQGDGDDSEAQRQTHSRSRRSAPSDREPCICKEGAAGWMLPMLVVLAVAVAVLLPACVILVVKNKQLSKNQQHPGEPLMNGHAK